MTIWVNVTTSASWRQPPFGIVRVERNLARELRRALGHDRVRYCVWDRRGQRFDETPDAALDGWSEGSGVHCEAPPALGGAQPRGRREALRSIGRGLRDILPAGLRGPAERLTRLGGRGAHGVAGILGSGISRIKAWNGRSASVSDDAAAGCLQGGDVLVTLGLEWETGCMPALQGLKERLDLRVIGCCHDVIPVKYPQYCVAYVADEFPQYLAQLARACDAIACVSECSLNDLRVALSGMGESVPPLFTIRLGADLPAGSGPPSGASAPLLGQPYVLFVSTMERRKNHEVLYRAFHRLAEIHERDELPRLVFVGARGWGVGDLLNDIALDPLTQGLIVQLHNVSDNDLRILYQNALFCVFPSIYEGWGLPVAEALGFGKPVICSDRGPLPELGGDLVEYVDPWDLPGWFRAIEGLWLDEKRRQRMAERIVRDYRVDDWSAAAREIGRVALELAGRPSDKAGRKVVATLYE